MLKIVTNEVPVELQNYYTDQGDGTFKLNVEGAVPVEELKAEKAKLKEFRDNNLRLAQQNETFTKIFGDGKDVTPDKIHEKINTLAEQRAIDRAAEMKLNYENRIKELETGLQSTSKNYSKLVLGRQVQDAVTKHGVHSSAIDDVLRRAEEAFEIQGEQLIYKSDKLDKEGKPYTVDTWAAELSKTAPHLFAASQGTGAKRPTSTGGRMSDSRSSAEKIASGLSQLSGPTFKKLT